jgi:hypothetical protein
MGESQKAIGAYKRYVSAIEGRDAAAAGRGQERIKALEQSAF